MISKEHIEKLLLLNGVTPAAPDEEIKSVLIRARWHEKDVETAIDVLRENVITHEKSVYTANNVFASDEKLQPATISSLLGITLDISEETIADHSLASKRRLSAGLMLQIAVVALVMSLIFVLAAMWYLEMGLFHQVGAWHSLRK